MCLPTLFLEDNVDARRDLWGANPATDRSNGLSIVILIKFFKKNTGPELNLFAFFFWSDILPNSLIDTR